MSPKTVAFTVTKQLPFGLFVLLEDGRTGVIRVREISWNAQERADWQELYPVQWHSQAVILRKGEGDQLELSLRLAENDPWEELSGRFQRGQVVTGVVTGVLNYGAFIQISPGITGLLHVSQLPSWVKKNPLDLFWPGDHVRVTILTIDPTKRRVSLGLAHTASVPSKIEDITQNFTRSVRSQPEQVPLDNRIDELLKSRAPQKYILLIEDDQEQANAVSIWLHKVGQRVAVAHCGAEGIALIEKELPDILMLDLGLPDISGMALARQMLEQWPQLRIVLTTDWARADENAQELESLRSRGLRFLLKPILPDDLLDMLMDREGDTEWTSRNELFLDLKSDLGVSDLNQPSLHQSIHALLDQCRTQAGFEAAFLFAIDPSQRTVEIIHWCGEILANHEYLASLVYSPVRDIAEDGDLVIREALADNEIPRFRYLLDFYPLASCLGVKVPAAGPSKYALVLLDSDPRRIPNEIVIYTQAIALTCGVLIEKLFFHDQFVLLQRTALLGHLTRGLVHEVNHQLGRLNLAVDKLENGLKGLQKEKTSTDAVDRRVQESLNSLAELRKATWTLTSTTRQFGFILTRTKTELVRIDELVKDSINMVKDISDRSKVIIHFEPPDELLVIRSQGAALEQVLINLLLNAIQQIVETHPQEGGWVRVWIDTKCASSDLRMFRILVEDNGPGIHTRQWEQIFEIGFTTREGGSGMGLYISRSLVESMGGKTSVAESHILDGTVFALEFPCQF